MDAPELDRKELLAQQFDEVEQATPEVVQPALSNEPAPEPVEEPVWSKPPTSWKKDYHEVWQTADPKLKEYAWQREEQMRAGVEPLITKAQFADQMQQVIDPYMGTIKSLGIAPQDAVKAMMEADRILRSGSTQEKTAYMASLARNYGVNLGEVGNLPQQAPIDPNVYALQNELNQVRGEVLTWKQQQEAAQNQVLLSEINSFAQKAEFFEDARPTMISLLNSGMATDLEDAYNKAVRLDENLSSQQQQALQAKMQTEKKVNLNIAAKAARAAAVSVRSSTPGVATATKAQDRRSLLSEQFDNMNERF